MGRRGPTVGFPAMAETQFSPQRDELIAERGEVDALAGSLSENLAEIEAALEKLEAGTYGQCEDCGQAIAPARLEAMPSARLCITCASKSH